MSLNSQSEVCPNCKVSLIAGEVLPENRHCYLGFVKDAKGEYVPAPDHGRPIYYYRTIGIYDMDRDRTVDYQCPDCGFRKDRDDR